MAISEYTRNLLFIALTDPDATNEVVEALDGGGGTSLSTLAVSRNDGVAFGATSYTVSWPTVLVDSAGTFTANDTTYTIPADGVYVISFRVNIFSASAPGQTISATIKNADDSIYVRTQVTGAESNTLLSGASSPLQLTAGTELSLLLVAPDDAFVSGETPQGTGASLFVQQIA